MSLSPAAGTVPELRKADAFISVVVPVRDASERVGSLVREIEAVVRPLFRHFEIVLVDDGSDDTTVATIQKLQKTVANVQLYALGRRSGLEVALVAGLDHCIGDFAFTLNPACDPASSIPDLWARIESGCEVVFGIPSGQAGWRPRWRSRVFSKIFAAATGIRIHPGASDFRGYSRQALGYIARNRDRHLMLRVLPFFNAWRIESVPYTPVQGGGGFLPKPLPQALFSGITMLLSSSIAPLRMLTGVSLLASLGSLLFAAYVIVVALVKRDVVEGWISITLPMALMFFLISTILGVISEYIFLLVQQSGNRPAYLVSQESVSSVQDVRQKLNVVGHEIDQDRA